MKNTNTIFSAILAIAVAILFILHFSKGSKSKATPTDVQNTETVAGATLPIAYVNLDSLLNNYTYAVELREKLMQKMESGQATINQQARSLEKEMQEFQRKVENNAFFDQGRAQREQERIMKKQQDFQMNSQKLQAELMQEEAEMNMMLQEDITAQINKYNAEIGKFQVIFSNAGSDNILYAEKVYDITEAVTKYLNDNYSPDKESTVPMAPATETK